MSSVLSYEDQEKSQVESIISVCQANLKSSNLQLRSVSCKVMWLESPICVVRRPSQTHL